MTPLVAAVSATIRRHAMFAGGERVLVAVSGGADSVALLHTLRTLAPSLRLLLDVLHVDHQLRADSARDADFVRALCAQLDVPCDVVRVTVQAGGSVEARARVARHAALAAHADRLGAARIALGHTRDDQAETVLMRLLEGAGPRGLAGMAAVRGRIVRPLFAVRRGDVVSELRAVGLPWIEDPSNRDDRFVRNRIRHHVLPALVATWGADVVDALDRVGARMRAVVEALDARAAEALDRLGRVERHGLVLPRGALAALSGDVAANVLRLAAGRLGSHAPLRAWAHRGLDRVLREPPARRPFRLHGVTVEVSGDWLRLSCEPPIELAARVLTVPGRTELDEIDGAIETRLVSRDVYVVPREPAHAAFDADQLTAPLRVRARRPGDRMRVFAGGERRLKSLFIDAKVPRWSRGRIPVVEVAGEIIWVAGLRRGALAPVTATTRRVLDLRFMSAGGSAALPITMRPRT